MYLSILIVNPNVSAVNPNRFPKSLPPGVILLFALLLCLPACRPTTYLTHTYTLNRQDYRANQPPLPLPEGLIDSTTFKLTYYGHQQRLYLVQKSDGSYRGRVLSWVYRTPEYDKNYRYKRKKVRRYDISSNVDEAAKIVVPRFRQINFGNFLPDTLISDYRRGWCSCKSSIYDVRADERMISVSYPCLDKQPLSPALEVPRMVDSLIHRHVNFDSIFSTLLTELPPEISYSRGHMNYFTWSKTNREYWIRSAPRRDYQRATKDSITALMTQHLNAAYQQLSSTEKADLDEVCYGGFVARFNRDGTFHSVAEYDSSPRDRDEDDRQCNRNMRRFLRKIKPAFELIYPPLCYVEVWEGEVTLSELRYEY